LTAADVHLLPEVAASLDAQPDRQYLLGFSVGIVTTMAKDSVTLDGLLTEADSLMYRQKQDRKMFESSR